MNRRPKTYSRLLLMAGVACLAMLLFASFAPDAWARVGGGQSYGGGGSGGSGEGAGFILWLIFRLLLLTIEYPAIGIPLDIVVVIVIIYIIRSDKGKKAPGSVCSVDAGHDVTQEFNQLRKFDPNFSEITFTDFCYALYARAQIARAPNRLDELSPYISEASRNALLQRNPANLQAVTGVIIGSMKVVNLQGLTSPVVRITVDFETNYTEIVGGNGQRPGEMTYYVREQWVMERNRDVLSPPPAQATALHCPRCGAALMKDNAGACAFCGVRVESGEFQWFVTSVTLHGKEARGPLLTSTVEEVGTDYPSIVQQNFDSIKAYFERNHQEFRWREFEARVQLIFNELQTAWSTLQWERARPHETDSIFQMHQYWIEAYKRQGLRNALDNFRITRMQPVKIKEDAFYNSITVRIWAEGHDYTVDRNGKIVSGSNKKLRRWSEYWTFIRNRNARDAHARADLNCPNCGAPLKINVTGICEYCRGKVTSGEFDWVLSKIEQDESYRG